jgi:hypothetical protein
MTLRNKKNPFDPDAMGNNMDFDSLEEKIRGDEFLTNEELKKAKEEREVKKKVDEYEVDKRLEELKKKIKPKSKS